MKRLILFLFLLAAAACEQPRQAVSGNWKLCPEPRSVTLTEESFVLDGNVCIRADENLRPQAALLQRLLQEYTGITPRMGDKGKCIVLKTDASIGAGLEPFRQEESYRLKVTATQVEIAGGSPVGVLRGIQTLLKGLPARVQAHEWPALQGGEIRDYPQFAYRAFMLDCSRHFFPVETVKKVIDIAALHQLNQFHWHLTDDQGWRLEIKKYPKLTEVGSYRPGSPVDGQRGHDGIPVSGFYTQQEAREVVAYAAERGIQVIPEIDLPGHMKAALASYPELGCTGGPYEVACEWGVLDDVLCAGKPQALDFVKDVLDEVMDIFPSTYIHLGGDECPKGRWEACPRCQGRIKELGLKRSGAKSAEELLQSWFMDQALSHVEAKGRRAIIWNDVLVDWGNQVVGAPSHKAVIAGWMRPVSSEIAVDEGYDAILCPVGHLYLSAADGNRLTGDAYFRRVYDLDVKPEKNYLGVEACLWSERVATEEDLLWKLLPRLSAVAELQWADPESKDFEAFLPRLYKMEEIYTARGWNWNGVSPDVVYTDASAFPLHGKAVEETSARYQRFPAEFKESVREPLWALSENSAGLYVRFRSNAPAIYARWTSRAYHMPHMTDVGVGGLDLYANLDGAWRFVGSGFNWGDIRKQHERKLVGNMDAVMREYMLYLPLYDCLDSLSIGIPRGYGLEAPELDSPRSDAPVVMYGTSILQGGCASRPGMAHTAILSRALDREVINLGFSGNAFLDTEVAQLISRVQNPSLIVLDYVPNASAEKIQSYGETFFRIIRKAHPEVPVVFVEDPLFPHSVVDKAILKEVTRKNRAQEELYLKLTGAGEPFIYYVPAEGMLGADGEATVDGYHLTDLGMMRYVDHILPTLKKALLRKR